MPRIRTLTAAGVVVGATVLGGAGLAAADMHEDDTSTNVEEVVEVDEAGDPIDPATLDTGEAEETEGETAETETDGATVEQTDTTEAETDDAEATEADNHGQYVSGVAQSTEPGPEHGATVSAAAQEQRDAKQAERGTETDDTEAETEDETEVEETEAPEDTETEAPEDTETEETEVEETEETEVEDAEEQEQAPAPQAAAGQGR